MKEENQKLKQELVRNTEEKNKSLGERKQLQRKINELKDIITGKISLQGAKHLIWDALSVEITKFRSYLNYIDDKGVIENVAFQRCKVVNETLDKNPLEISQNTTDFLNTLTYEDMQEMGIKDKTAIIIWARKTIGKHDHVKNVQDKANQMLLQFKGFKN